MTNEINIADLYLFEILRFPVNSEYCRRDSVVWRHYLLHKHFI